ncbi:phage tail tube protein [uncultured Variovorax sp.]|uniref:phage tail tube protein n=1 Tax=uncultured Variovorax sp. TaxID=114708 RepID=UPI0026011228|nr:phage tail tube protein [uncultured Variovorax sp.]
MATTKPVIKSQGTELYYASAATTVQKIVCPTGISGLGGARAQIDVTCLDDTEDEEFVGGLGTPGQVTIPFNLHKSEISHEKLMELKASGETVSWGIYSSNAATAPTAVGSVMQPVVGRVSAIFNAYVADVAIDIGPKDIWKGTITLQRSGPVVWDLLTA